MKIALIVAAALIALAGCSSEKKMESVCIDLIKSMDADPASLKINNVRHHSGAVSNDVVDEYFIQRNPKGLSASVKERKNNRLKYLEKSKQIFVEVDYTTKNVAGGPLRDNALCRYVRWDDQFTDLLTLTIRNADYGYEKLFNLNLLGKRPAGLSSSLRLN